jgi:photosystem II stability/assembly factor-like uncharacterized protein
MVDLGCLSDCEDSWEVGSDGLILRTEDGGDTWRKQVSGVSVDLNSVGFHVAAVRLGSGR